MKPVTIIDQAETITHPTNALDGDSNPEQATGQAPEVQTMAAGHGRGTGRPESELRAAARLHGLTMKQLAAKMGVSPSYPSQVSTGRKPWS